MIAFVLAAGLGTRFRPATLTTPKPLLPLAGRPMLFHLLDHLLSQGADRFVLNAHHLPGALREAVGEQYGGIPVAWSFEDPILGTAGAIRCAAERGLLGDGPFVVANGDLYTTLPLGHLLHARQEDGVVSALAVLPNDRPDVDTPLWADARGRLLAVGGSKPESDATGPWLFTGLQAARRELVGRIPPGVSELARHVLVPSAAKRDGAFALVPYRVPGDGLWFDLGTPERLAAAEAALRAS
ncbi:MAG TPA: NTP transferase domain-containing protein [Thermoanaerobaculia bacterium]|nr:NTP transferase domain-containing protein [Thermoanaerobaculia bacterium]HQR66023.1 NTP transferase domain-containing protein [Thermoanaerobaculia bacterium]